VNFLFKTSHLSSKDRLQGRLFQIAGLFLFLYGAILSLAPAVRLHSWDVEYRWKHWLGFGIWLLGWSLVHHISVKYLPDRDPLILPITGLMTGWGLLTIWRLDEYFGLRQTIWLLVCLVLVLLGLRSHHLLGFLRRYKYIWLTTGLLLMILTFIIGLYPSGEGPRLWLGCCGIYLQPSEPLKLLLIVYLAAYLSERVPLRFQLIPLIVPSLVLTGSALVILLAQRDLGTASIFMMLYAAIIFLASGKRRVALFSLAALILAGVAGYRLFGVIRTRVDAWVNPWLDPAGGSYQIIQSLQALAAGGVIGSGPGMGSPGVVPVAHSDFIFAAISEETGLLGSFAILILIGLFVIRSLIIAAKSPNLYLRFLAAGLSISIGLQSLLIVGGNIRFLPLTGVTLPFFSYGGSSLITSLLSVMILTIISNQTSESLPEITLNRSFQYTSLGFLALLMAAGSMIFWWTIIRGETLLNRSDNLRPVITDRFVKRGSLLDRNNQPINQTIGTPGSYTREYLVPSLGNLLGYTHSTYGLSGLELNLDDYLRGLKGTPVSTIWYDRVFSAQTPVGNDVRLTIDLMIQAKADELLGSSTGAVILLNAGTGEILAAASHPGIDPSKLDEFSESWKADPNSPYLNRVLQGSYPIGTSFGPFLLARLNQVSPLPNVPSTLSIFQDGENWDCLTSISETITWGDVISGGCPSPVIVLAEQFSTDQVVLLFHQLGFYSSPSLSLPLNTPSEVIEFPDTLDAIFGSLSPHISPLQMALATAAITHSGVMPAPRLVLTVNTPDQGWVALPSASPATVLMDDKLIEITNMLRLEDIPAWSSLAQAKENGKTYTWFIGGTLSDWRGAPLALVVVLEKDDPKQALTIGSELFSFIFQP
jgi:cell division protein FtsW (lipid II flippase)